MSKLNLTKQVPELVSGISLIDDFYNAYSIELDSKKADVNDLFNQLFVETATWGLLYWEEFLDINTDITKSYEVRRNQVKTKLLASRTLTKQLLLDVFASYGSGVTTITENRLPYIVETHSTEEVPDEDIYAMFNSLRNIFPAHINLISTFETENINWSYTKGEDSVSDLYNDLPVYQAQIFEQSVSDITKGAMLKFRVSDVKNAASSGNKITLDKLQLTPNSSYRVRKTPTDASYVYTGTWSTVNDSSYLMSTIRQSATTNSKVKMTFTGDLMDFYLSMGPDCGIAQLYIDGVFANSYDLYKSTHQKRAIAFTRTFTMGSHYIEIIVGAGKNASSTGYNIRVEALGYHPDVFYQELGMTGRTVALDKYWFDEANASHSGGYAITSSTPESEIHIAIDPNISYVRVYGLKGPNCGMVEINSGVYNKIDYNVCNDNMPIVFITNDNQMMQWSLSDSYGNIFKSDIETGEYIFTNQLGYVPEINISLNFISGFESNAGDLFYYTFRGDTLAPMLIKCNSLGVYQAKGIIGAANAVNAIYDSTNDYIYCLANTGSTNYSGTIHVIKASDMSLVINKSFDTVGYQTLKLIGAIDGLMYAYEQKNISSVMHYYIAAYNSALVEVYRVEITAQSLKNFTVSKDSVWYSYNTNATNASYYQGADNPYYMIFNKNLTVKKAAATSPLGLYFKVTSDNEMYGIKSADFSTKATITKYKSDYTEDWTNLFYFKNTADADLLYPAEYCNWDDIIFDRHSFNPYYRLADKKVVGYIKRFRLR